MIEHSTFGNTKYDRSVDVTDFYVLILFWIANNPHGQWHACVEEYGRTNGARPSSWSYCRCSCMRMQPASIAALSYRLVGVSYGDIFSGSEFFLLSRRPENCAHSAVSHPTAPPPTITNTSPRPYSQLNSGTVILNPSKRLFASISRFLYTSDKISEWTFPDQDLLSEYFKGKWRAIPWYFNALRSLPSVHPRLWQENEIRCLHYIFADKPWHARITPPGSDKGFDVMNRWWWEHFDNLGEIMKGNDPEGWKLVLSTVDNML